ncbi:MAG: 3'-5' exonuclease domain-containing protein 2 [Verrucomicrobia bacterium]|nr:3'-5' exonuclease domain-containing protein 2 [Verrucomicrobiota bacterium]
MQNRLAVVKRIVLETRHVNAIPHEITREALALLPVQRYEGTIVVVATGQELERAMHDIRRERVVGFDTETPPTFRKGQSHRPTLAQVATAHAAYLFQLKRMDFAGALTELLESPGIIKTGVALADDLRKLKERFPFTERNIVDLGVVARRHGLKQSGVRNLAGIFLGFRITKGPRTSNWRRPILAPAQIHYAATDAWVCRELFLHFERLGWC